MVRAIHHFEFLAAGGSTADYSTPRKSPSSDTNDAGGNGDHSGSNHHPSARRPVDRPPAAATPPNASLTVGPSAHTTPRRTTAQRSADKLGPASTGRRRTSTPRSSVFARAPNKAFFADAHSPTSLGAQPPRCVAAPATRAPARKLFLSRSSLSPELTVRDLRDPQADTRAEEQFAASLRPA